MSGDFGQETWAYLDFKFKKCVNSTENKNHCQSIEEINRRLDGGYFGMFITDTLIQPANYTFPSFSFGKNIYTTFSIRAYREFWMYFKNLQLTTDSGWLMEDSNTQDYFAVDFSKETWDYRDTSQIFFTLAFRTSPNRQVFERNYIKVQEVAASVGGLIKFLLVCGEILVFHFRYLHYQDFLIDTFFHKETEANELSEKEGELIINYKSHNFQRISENRNENLNVNNQIQISQIKKNINNINPTTKLSKKTQNPTENTNSNIKLINNTPINLINLNKNLQPVQPSLTSKENYYTDRNLNIQGNNYNLNYKNNPNFNTNLKTQHNIFSNTILKNKTTDSSKLSKCQILFSLFYKSTQVKKRIKFIESVYNSLEIKLDFLHFIKIQNEFDFIKNILFTSSQNQILSLVLMQRNEESLNVRNNI